MAKLSKISNVLLINAVIIVSFFMVAQSKAQEVEPKAPEIQPEIDEVEPKAPEIQPEIDEVELKIQEIRPEIDEVELEIDEEIPETEEFKVRKSHVEIEGPVLESLYRPTHDRFNLHLGVGYVRAFGGDLNNNNFGKNGVSGTVGFDIVLIEPLALSFQGGFNSLVSGSDSITTAFIGVGFRLRFFADTNGWLSQGGTAAGNLWLDAHFNYFNHEHQDIAGYDIGLGYEFALFKNINIGPFVRFMHAAIAKKDDITYSALSMGLAFSIAGETEVAPKQMEVEESDIHYEPQEAVDESEVYSSLEYEDEYEEEKAFDEAKDYSEYFIIDQDRIKLAEPIVFEEKEDRVLDASVVLLDKLAMFLQDNPQLVIRIESHCAAYDEGRRGAAFELTQKRADAIKIYLMAQGVEEVRLIAKGRGDKSPLDGDSEEESANNRIELHIVKVEIGEENIEKAHEVVEN